MMILDVFWGWF